MEPAVLAYDPSLNILLLEFLSLAQSAETISLISARCASNFTLLTSDVYIFIALRVCYCCVAKRMNENCVDLRDINLDFHGSQGGSQECCKMPTSTLLPSLCFLQVSSFRSFRDEIMSNWISSASTLSNGNISDVTLLFFGWQLRRRDLNGKKNEREKHFQIRFLRWCDVLSDVVKSMQKLFTTKRCDVMREGGDERWENCRIHIAVYRQHSRLISTRGLPG